MSDTHHERPANHPHWHVGVFHVHPHTDGHHGIAFRKQPKVIHVGENLEEKLAASIEKAKERDAD